MPEAIVELAGRVDPWPVRINGPDSTFFLGTEQISSQAVADLDSTLIDLLEIAATVFAADGNFTRGTEIRSRMGLAWRRDFRFTIPVRNLSLWSQTTVIEALTETVEFLTDDKVRFDFVDGQFPVSAQPYLDFDPGAGGFRADEVILFSGGLDSYAGALEKLSTTSVNVILVSHQSAQKVIPRQNDLAKYLAKKFPGRVLHIQVMARRRGSEARDTTQRSRSLLFAALGQVIAKSFGASRVSFYENGIVSHNLPLSPQIVGTMATRTTHPLSLTKLQNLMTLVGFDPVPLENRYQWLTKSDVVRRIKEHGGEGEIAKAVSCTSVREQTTLHTHCGACTQCLDRRFAIMAKGLQKFDFDVDYATDVLFGERSTDRSRVLSVEWTRHMMAFEDMDERSMMSNFGLEVARILQGHPTLTPEASFERTIVMHRRQATIVRNVLETAIAEKAADLASQKIPATSLVRMHISGQVLESPTLAIPLEGFRPPRIALSDIDETDFNLTADGPFVVEFSYDQGVPVVGMLGIGRVTGQPALIPHALRPGFDEDVESGMEARLHRYFSASELPLLNGLSKEAVRANVKRCRTQLAADFSSIFGEEPEQPLLIQNKPSRGYRLDPTILPFDSAK